MHVISCHFTQTSWLFRFATCLFRTPSAWYFLRAPVHSSRSPSPRYVLHAVFGFVLSLKDVFLQEKDVKTTTFCSFSLVLIEKTLDIVMQRRLAIIVDGHWHDVGVLHDAVEDGIDHHAQQADLRLQPEIHKGRTCHIWSSFMITY